MWSASLRSTQCTKFARQPTMRNALRKFSQAPTQLKSSAAFPLRCVHFEVTRSLPTLSKRCAHAAGNAGKGSQTRGSESMLLSTGIDGTVLKMFPQSVHAIYASILEMCSKRAPKGFSGFGKSGKSEGGAGKSDWASESSRTARDAESGKSGNGGGGSGRGGGGGGGGGNDMNMYLAALVALGLFFLFPGFEGRQGPPPKEISVQHFNSNLLAAGRVRKLTVVNGNTVRVHVTDAREASDSGSLEWKASAPAAESPPAYYFTIGSMEHFEERLEQVQAELGIAPRDYVPVQFVTQQSIFAEVGRFIPTLLLIGFFYLLSRGAMSGMGGAGGGIFNVGKSKAVKATKVDTRFKDVAGLQEAKVEIMEFVDILQNPERYTKLGAKIPKGALLVGPPGCGKTLLAKATAGEAKAPFYSMSGSDFIEMFVGVGPSRVRDLFAQARANAPCLVFIDEIDAVGRARGRGGFNGGNDERENTLNQLLIELDGFNPSTGIVVLAGTNRPDILDPALLRPGRFDRQVVVDKPDIKGRAEIFAVHLAHIKLDKDIETYARKMAALTPGFSGAEVANVCNEAALIAARRKLKVVGQECFDAAIDRVIAGLEKKDLTIDPRERRVIAFHEAGHALVGWVLEHADPVMKVSIVPRGKGALGYSQSLPRDVPLYTESQLADMMCMALGGRAAEDVVFNEVSSGAQNDLERVTKMAHSQVTVFGMSDAVGPLSFGNQEESSTLYRPYSEKTAQLIDGEVETIIATSYARAVDLLRKHKDQLTKLAEALLEREVIGTEDLIRVLGPRPFKKSVEWDEFINASWDKAKADKSTSAEGGSPQVPAAA
mmetsp:Transcript_20307/g.44042  ORF Transcript_20307/g.44042 Transcript_20307/m.44042 type:complete len:829 (+) Transcript_20307:168-2654(+)